MVYKRYIRRNGKVYGPYVYHSKKEGHKVVSKYLGKSKKSGILPFILLGLILFILILIFLNYSSITGFSIFTGNPQNNLAVIRTVIEIKSAEHLDSSRQFISDIYNQVKALDDVWSETINNNEYVRVVFEQELDSSKDITVFPRIVDGNPRIEVYEINETEVIAEFTNIIPDKYNKVYLTNLQGTQNTFDLKVLDGSLEFDYIYDPSTSSSMKVVE